MAASFTDSIHFLLTAQLYDFPHLLDILRCAAGSTKASLSLRYAKFTTNNDNTRSA